MHQRAKLYLLDILNSIDNIERFTAVVSEPEMLQQDEVLLSAVMYQLVIVGEAVASIPQYDESIEFEYGRAIRGFRNIIVHGYFKVDYSIVWRVLKEHIPALKAEVQALLTV